MTITLKERQLLSIGLHLFKNSTKKEIEELITDGVHENSEEYALYKSKLQDLGEIELLNSKLGKEELVEIIAQNKDKM